VLCFAAGLANQFISDDRFLILERLAAGRVTGPASFLLEDYWGGVFPTYLYRPLGLFFIYLERLAFGTAAWPYHVVSLAIHVLNSLLVLRLWRRCVDSDTAWLAAVLFAVHPIHAEAVVPVYGQFDLLAATLVFLAVLKGPSPAGLALLFAAMLTKESAITAPALVWLAHSVERRALWRRSDLLLATPLIPYLALRFVALGSLTIAEESTVAGGFGTGLWVTTVFVTAAHAFRLLVFPTGQTIYYGHLRDSLTGVPLFEILWLAAAVWLAAWILSRRKLAEVVGLGWLLIALFPVLNVIPIGTLVAERALYLPSAGAVVLFAMALAKAPRAVTSVVLVVAMIASASVSRDWRNEESVWRSTVGHHPRSPKANALLSLELLKKGDDLLLPEAEKYARAALNLNPRSPDALFAMGWILTMRGDCSQALPLLRQAQRLRPGDAGIGGMILGCTSR
jgi:hypothetical protein